MENQTQAEDTGYFDFEALLEKGDTSEPAQEDDGKGFEFQDEVEKEPQQEQESDPTEDGSEEIKAVDAEPSEEVKKEIKKEEAKAQTTSNFSNLAKKYIERGLWQDYNIKVGDEEKAITDLEDLDEETFFQIQEAQKAETETDLKDNYISKNDLDEISLQVVEISKNGGDISDVLRIKKEFIDPLETFDLTNEHHQEQLVRQMYQLQNGITDEKQLRRIVQGHKDDLDLDVKAQEFADKLKQSFNHKLESERQRAVDNIENEKKSLKELRKDLKQNLLGMGMKEIETKAFLDSATQKGEEGFKIDQDFAQLKKDPARLAEFLLWYNNPEEYKKKVAGKEVTKNSINTMKTLDLIPRSSQKKESAKGKTPIKTDLDEEFLKALESK